MITYSKAQSLSTASRYIAQVCQQTILDIAYYLKLEIKKYILYNKNPKSGN